MTKLISDDLSIAVEQAPRAQIAIQVKIKAVSALLFHR